MDEYRENRNYGSYREGGNSVAGHRKIRTVFANVLRRCRAGGLTLAGVAAVVLAIGGGSVQSALADGKPPLTLTAVGPHNAKAGSPLNGIKVQLINPGLAVRDSRLRLFIHDGLDRVLGPDDIKIDVREGRGWKPVQVEAIDGGVMGAVGAAGKSHSERHQRGGFAIGGNTKKAWQLRVTFRSAGRYSMVLSVSPDNGATQLAQPASYDVEVL